MARILVIDDNDQVRFFARHALEQAGHQISEAVNGAEGLKIFQREGADVIVCDIFMPEREGLETIREVLRCSPNQKIIAMSGGMPSGGMNFLPLAKAIGAAKVLSKPFAAAVLVSAVEAILQEDA